MFEKIVYDKISEEADVEIKMIVIEKKANTILF